jgi:hypothetical protein
MTTSTTTHSSDSDGEVTESIASLYLAEYETPDACVGAAEKLRDAGYTKFDTHTPYPVHGMDAAMGLRDTPLGWIVFVLGLTGCLTGFVMMTWMNGIDYPLVIGGKPPDAIPSMVPVMFELTILLSAFGAVFGLFGLCQLPRHHHPIFESGRFARATDDRFFVSVDASDPKFDLKKTRLLLEGTTPAHLELVEEHKS